MPQDTPDGPKIRLLLSVPAKQIAVLSGVTCEKRFYVKVKEIKMHGSYSVVAAITGLGLVGLGILVSPSSSDLGWLLALVGILRAVSALFDLGRKDQLQKSLERIDEKAGLKLGNN